jgi:hypothetical protein
METLVELQSESDEFRMLRELFAGGGRDKAGAPEARIVAVKKVVNARLAESYKRERELKLSDPTPKVFRQHASRCGASDALVRLTKISVEHHIATEEHRARP